ncbi:lysophospholipid acyltransferase family protein [Nocardioides sp. WV_118_6]|uniref:lysophospholipid acyltransferase family protein n=1 Tax=Nocardioides simplex TaxID=2045 RepID=UPI0021500EF8|nr:lysophospholipid acyltransferase family protein [Pimelobacter simplex]UUW89337.1 1-acyl-sn-glycerol-3-phosphate acyltransferase [Pimelobacter simplex]UUW93165.1 1-acyl-sn-glycerol-3-phosphate acyltransferase [Pimelobacter simplex]
MTVRKLQEKRGWAFNIAVPILKPTLLATTRREWIGGENIPETGGFIIALNHISHADPLTAAHLVYDHGYKPRYLAKSGLFDNKVLGYFLRGAGQIPVKRETKDAVGAYAAAVDAVRAGECVVIYPEATITRDPDMWPMKGKSGAARIALETGCPVIPVGQWGAQEILAPYTKRPHLVPRHKVTMRVGPPVDLADLRAQEPRTSAIVNQATDRIMDAITHQLELVRGETAPAERYDMAVRGDRFKKKKAN